MPDFTREQLKASIETRRIQFVPAYSGGLLYTSAITLPEPVEVNGETYPAGEPFPVVVDFATIQLPSDGRLPILYNHNSAFYIGHTEKITSDGKQLTMEGVLTGDSRWFRKVRTILRQLKSSGTQYDIQKYGIQASISLESQLSDDLGELDRVGEQLVYALLGAQTTDFWTMFW